MGFEQIKGKSIIGIEGLVAGSERVVFHFADGTAAESIHLQECCESVAVNEVIGTAIDVIGFVVNDAIESAEPHGLPEPRYPDSWTWTTQTIYTDGGKLVIRWLGESNGYYGETPYFQIAHGKLI